MTDHTTYLLLDDQKSSISYSNQFKFKKKIATEARIK